MEFTGHPTSVVPIDESRRCPPRCHPTSSTSILLLAAVVIGTLLGASLLHPAEIGAATPSVRLSSKRAAIEKGTAIRFTITWTGSEPAVAIGGHEIGNHTWGHPMLTRASVSTIKRELSRTSTSIKKKYGVTPKTYRPPYGATSKRVKEVASDLGLRQTLWTVDSLDWRYRSSSAIKSRVLSQVHEDAVVLFHDGGGNRSATAAALPGIQRALKRRGYHFVTVSELNEIKRYR